jgi:uncharacterized tellurite resistance protein B-like protein
MDNEQDKPMQGRESQSWSLLHDLGLIYLALAHGTDAEIAPPEADAMYEKLQTWHPDAAPERLRRVLDEVMLAYVSASHSEMLETAVSSIAQSVPVGQRVAILNDLAELAAVDGRVVVGEVEFIQALADRWGVGEV